MAATFSAFFDWQKSKDKQNFKLVKTTFKIQFKFAIQNSKPTMCCFWLRKSRMDLLTKLMTTNHTDSKSFWSLFPAVMILLAMLEGISMERRAECTHPSSCRTGTKPSVWMTHWLADCCSFCVSLLSEMPCSRRSSPKFPATAWWPWAAAWDISISRLLLFSRYMIGSAEIKITVSEFIATKRKTSSFSECCFHWIVWLSSAPWGDLVQSLPCFNVLPSISTSRNLNWQFWLQSGYMSLNVEAGTWCYLLNLQNIS